MKLELELQQKLQENDNEKQKLQNLLDKKNVYEGHLDTMINNISDAKERLMNLKEQKEKAQKKVEVGQNKVKKFQDELEGF